MDRDRQREFEVFVRARYAPLLRFSWLLTGDWALAEDLLQASLAKLWLRWGRLRDPAGAEGYTRRVLVTTQARWWRRRSSGELPVQDLPEMATVDAFAAVDDRDVLIRLLSTLNGRQRAVLALHFYDGLSEEEVATVLGCAIGTVKSAGARALDRLERSGLLSEEVEAGGKES